MFEDFATTVARELGLSSWTDRGAEIIDAWDMGLSVTETASAIE